MGVLLPLIKHVEQFGGGSTANSWRASGLQAVIFSSRQIKSEASNTK